MEEVNVEALEVKRKGGKLNGSTAEAVNLEQDFQKCLTVLKSFNYFPIDACNESE